MEMLEANMWQRRYRSGRFCDGPTGGRQISSGIRYICCIQMACSSTSRWDVLIHPIWMDYSGYMNMPPKDGLGGGGRVNGLEGLAIWKVSEPTTLTSNKS